VRIYSNPKGFAFVEFLNREEAEEAQKGMVRACLGRWA